MSLTSPITQRELARRCEVHPSTVCLALRNAPSIPAATRLRIQEMAHELGYRLNVAARNLAFLRQDRTAMPPMPLAWVNQEPERDFWRRHPEGRRLLAAAAARAAGIGYYLEEFWAGEPGMSAARLTQIIRTRGIAGVAFPVHSVWTEALIEAGWDEFALVAMNDHRAASHVDTICPDYYRNLDLTLDHAAEQGFRRIGLALSTEFDRTSRGLVRSGYLRFNAGLGAGARLRVCVLPEEDGRGARTAALLRWMRTARPDVVMLRAADYPAGRPPIDVATVDLKLEGECPDRSGIDERPEQIAAAAIDCLAAKIQRFEKGRSAEPEIRLIAGSWCPGRLPARLVSAA